MMEFADLAKYAPIPTRIIFADASKSLLHSYCRLRAAAWQNDFRHITLNENQALAILKLQRRQFFSHIDQMVALDWITYSRPHPHKIVIEFPPEDVQFSAPIVVDVVKLSYSDSFKDVNKLNLTTMPESGAINRTIFDDPTITGKTRLVLNALQQLGVKASPAAGILNKQPLETIINWIDCYLWALAYEKASGVGWLVSALMNDWELHPGYDPEKLRCPKCGHIFDDHVDGCPLYWNHCTECMAGYGREHYHFCSNKNEPWPTAMELMEQYKNRDPKFAIQEYANLQNKEYLEMEGELTE